jgi:RNA polymerase-interacting CarD/CdnL/TRCF family regulator
MSTIFQSRLACIRQAEAKGTPQALARTVRDLWARQKRRGKLSNTEGLALRQMIDRLLAEWSISLEMDENQMSKKFYALLHQHALAVESA